MASVLVSQPLLDVSPLLPSRSERRAGYAGVWGPESSPVALELEPLA
jgi:hypothetical protein